MNTFKKDYNRYIQSWSGEHGSYIGGNYVNEIEKAINQSTEVFENIISSNNKGIDYLKGDIAEFWHAETLKMDSLIKGDKDAFVNVPRNTGPVDIVYGNSNFQTDVQLKYYKNAEETTKAISNPKFQGMEKVVPKDQLNDVQEHASKLTAKNLENRPYQAMQYEDTANSATDRLRVGSSESKPLTEQEAKQLAQDLKDGKYDPNKYGLDTQSLINFSDIARQSGEAAIQAVLIGAVLKAGPILYKIIEEGINRGEIDLNNLRTTGAELVSDTPWNGLRAGVASFLTASSRAGLLGETMKNVSPTVIGAATVIAVNSIRNGILLYKGDISSSEFAERCIRDTVIISFGVLGAGIGQSTIPIPILGALIGNFVGGVLGTIVYQGGNHLIIALAVDKGWTFFNFVEQDYSVPEYVLKRAGYELFTNNTFNTSSFSPSSFNNNSFSNNSIEIVSLKRGLFGIRRISYK